MSSELKPREVGILFRGDMVRAILAGQKTETRRPTVFPRDWAESHAVAIATRHNAPSRARWRPGDRLWVRETFAIEQADDGQQFRLCIPDNDQSTWLGHPIRAVYRADGEREGWTWRPGIHLPRWACRITLPVLAVRAERLTEITDAGTVAEGFVHAGLGSTAADYCREYRRMHGLADDADPWVWVISFGPAEVTHG